MIKTFKHRGLERFYQTNSKADIDPQHAKKLRAILSALDAAAHTHQLQGFQVHPLRLAMQGLHSIKVSGNWRVVFRFEDGNAYEVDYLDYH